MVKSISFAALVAVAMCSGCKTAPVPSKEDPTIPIKVGMTRETVEEMMGDQGGFIMWGYGFWVYKYDGFKGRVMYDSSNRVVSVSPDTQ